MNKHFRKVETIQVSEEATLVVREFLTKDVSMRQCANKLEMHPQTFKWYVTEVVQQWFREGVIKFNDD